MDRIFKHSKYDVILFILILLEINLTFCSAIYWNEFNLLIKIGWILVSAFFAATNYQCIAHNIIHTPFFESEVLNKLTSILNSIAIGMPQTLYYEHHMNHHRFNNDPIDPATGTTKDHSSLYRHGNNGKVENFFSYGLLGLVRTPIHLFAKSSVAKGNGPLLLAEFVSLLTFWICLLIINPVFFIQGYALSWLLGQVFAFWENYLEHLGATPNDRLRDSVSCYNRLYNLVWFNNGYHQEHHYRPTIHWTQIPKVRSELPSDRKVLKISHWFNI